MGTGNITGWDADTGGGLRVAHGSSSPVHAVQVQGPGFVKGSWSTCRPAIKRCRTRRIGSCWRCRLRAPGWQRSWQGAEGHGVPWEAGVCLCTGNLTDPHSCRWQRFPWQSREARNAGHALRAPGTPDGAKQRGRCPLLSPCPSAVTARAMSGAKCLSAAPLCRNVAWPSCRSWWHL